MAFTTIADFRRRWEKLDLISLTADAMGTQSPEIVELNKDQLNEGVLKTGSSITPSYAPLTVYYKREQGKEYRFVTLRDTGEFQSKMFLSLDRDTFKIDSSDWKATELTAKYSDDIFGLTSENKRLAWNELISPMVVQAIKNLTGAI